MDKLITHLINGDKNIVDEVSEGKIGGGVGGVGHDGLQCLVALARHMTHQDVRLDHHYVRVWNIIKPIII